MFILFFFLLIIERTGLKFLKSSRTRIWPDIRRRIRPEPDSVLSAALLCMLMMCIKLHD